MRRLLLPIWLVLWFAIGLMVFPTSQLGCQTSLNPSTQPSVDDEVGRWNASIRFWRQRVADLQIAVAGTPINSDTRATIEKELQTAEYWLTFFEGATSQAATQPVPAGVGLKGLR